MNYLDTPAEQHCIQSITTVNGRRINCKGKLLFDEQFTGDVNNRWSPDVRMPLETEAR